jgi:hypothetical protein
MSVRKGIKTVRERGWRYDVPCALGAGWNELRRVSGGC